MTGDRAETNQSAESRRPVSQPATARRILPELWTVTSWVLSVPLIVAVRIYQWTLSPLIGPVCRFHPSCSNYFILAVRKYGPIWGTLKGLHRITRCHPWNPGGYDPP
ncbi:MAG: membrane protein insertion efficiency factor YidD [Planctomyces sp.]|nr:membrane protein insertion efficiency factor YidD [Planctomyces sp.]